MAKLYWKGNQNLKSETGPLRIERLAPWGHCKCHYMRDSMSSRGQGEPFSDWLWPCAVMSHPRHQLSKALIKFLSILAHS